MKLWKKTVALMLTTLLFSLVLVGGLSLFLTGKRALENTVQTFGRQLKAAASLMEQYWDGSQYSLMSETGKKAYREFQFRMCYGDGYALINRESGEVEGNFIGYQIVDLKAMDIPEDSGAEDYRIQRLDGKILLLQQTVPEQPEGYLILSVRNITDVFAELRSTALMFLIICFGIFLLAGLFIYRMMRRTVRSMEELQEVAGKQEMLLGALAHEMKTPLTSIIGYSDSLRHVKLGEEQRDRALEHIEREGRRLETLSGKLLELLGLHRNRAIHMEDYSVKELFDRIRTLEEARAEKKDVCFSVECEDFSMKMDPALMESLLVNLIDNAFHAVDKGGRVSVRAGRENGKIFFRVSDNGHGIPEKDLDRVTEAFYMADKSRSRQNGGAGLGLALCESIARLHKGKLTVESREGEGTVVSAVF